MASSKNSLVDWSAEKLLADPGHYYSCTLKNVNLSRPKEKIVLENSKEIEASDDVEAVAIVPSSTVKYFPIELGLKFPNLVALEITGCGLLKISMQDLKGYRKLKELWLWNNKIKELPGNLFLSSPSLEVISFKNNVIETIGTHLLTPLKRLRFCDFRENVNIDMCYVKDSLEGSTIEEIDQHINKRCQPSNKDLFKSYAQKLRDGNCSDFIIKVDAEEFKVHKWLLSLNSPVFEAMFDHEMQENRENQMVIVDFSEEVVEAFLEFIYLRTLPENAMNFIDLYGIAAKYQIEELEQIARSSLLGNISPANVCDVFLLGHLHNDMELKNVSFMLTRDILAIDLPDSLMNHPDRVKKLLEAKANRESKLEAVEKDWSNALKQLLGNL